MIAALRVEYSGGLDVHLDDAIEKLAGQKRWASGITLATQVRDIAIDFPSKEAAEEAAERIAGLGIKVSTKVEVR